MGETREIDDDLTGQAGALPVCRHCGSSGVLRDAWASWNPETGHWELDQVFDDGYCRSCEATTKFFDWRKQAKNRTETIRNLNDAFRTGRSTDGVIVVTAGIQAKGSEFVSQLGRAVAAFDDFNADNDPHGEHDFGALELDGEKVFFKIDTYDLSMTMMSPDPADRAVTRRVMTIMLAREY